MVQISFRLPAKYRLSISLTKKRKDLDIDPLLPDLGKVLRAKKGNKFSRYFRMVFENDRIKKNVGTNLAILILASSLLPNTTTGTEAAQLKNINSPIIFNTEQGVQYPVKKIKMTQQFRFYHPGIDFDGITGDAVYPIMSGRISKIEYSRFGYGKSIIVSHGNDAQSLYAHLSKIEVIEGQEVSKETKLGEMGATGRAFGDHLHLEVYENGKAINPLSILPQ